MRTITVAGLTAAVVGLAATTGASAAPANGAIIGDLATATAHATTVHYWGGYGGYGHWRWGSHGGYGGYGHWRWGSHGGYGHWRWGSYGGYGGYGHWRWGSRGYGGHWRWGSYGY